MFKIVEKKKKKRINIGTKTLGLLWKRNNTLKTGLDLGDCFRKKNTFKTGIDIWNCFGRENYTSEMGPGFGVCFGKESNTHI